MRRCKDTCDNRPDNDVLPNIEDHRPQQESVVDNKSTPREPANIPVVIHQDLEQQIVEKDPGSAESYVPQRSISPPPRYTPAYSPAMFAPYAVQGVIRESVNPPQSPPAYEQPVASYKGL